MWYDTDLGMESTLGMYTALVLERIAWTTLPALARRCHSLIVDSR